MIIFCDRQQHKLRVQFNQVQKIVLWQRKKVRKTYTNNSEYTYTTATQKIENRYVFYKYVKPSQNRKSQKFFLLHHFLNAFLQLAADKKDSKNGTARKFFGPSYFVTALVCLESYFLPFNCIDFIAGGGADCASSLESSISNSLSSLSSGPRSKTCSFFSSQIL